MLPPAVAHRPARCHRRHGALPSIISVASGIASELWPSCLTSLEARSKAKLAPLNPSRYRRVRFLQIRITWEDPERASRRRRDGPASIGLHGRCRQGLPPGPRAAAAGRRRAPDLCHLVSSRLQGLHLLQRCVMVLQDLHAIAAHALAVSERPRAPAWPAADRACPPPAPLECLASTFPDAATCWPTNMRQRRSIRTARPSSWPGRTASSC